MKRGWLLGQEIPTDPSMVRFLVIEGGIKRLALPIGLAELVSDAMDHGRIMSNLPGLALYLVFILMSLVALGVAGGLLMWRAGLLPDPVRHRDFYKPRTLPFYYVVALLVGLFT